MQFDRTNEKTANRAQVYKLIEDHWRLTFESNCTSNEQIDALENTLRSNLQIYGESLPEGEQSKVLQYAQSIAQQFSDECERDARAMRRRLCGPKFDHPAPAAARPGAPRNIIIETAVRATIWQMVASLFKR